MKKFILPLMLLLLVGSLFAVESDPSAVVGYVKYDLVAGYNTIALPMAQSYTMASEVGDAMSADVVMKYDASIQAWRTASPSPFGGWEDDFSVSNGQGLLVTVGTAGSFYSIGDLPATDPTYSLLAGYNMIMVPLNRSDLNLASLVGDDIGADVVMKYDASIQAWRTASPSPFGGWDDDFATAIGNPHLITTGTAGTWPSRAVPAMSRSAKNKN